jgi:hypothetical protein
VNVTLPMKMANPLGAIDMGSSAINAAAPVFQDVVVKTVPRGAAGLDLHQ